MFKLKLNNKKIPEYHCKLSNITMNKPCPLHQCHANVRNCHHSNCLYQFYNNKTEFDKYDIMYATNLNEKTYRERYIAAKAEIYGTAALFNIISRLRDNNRNTHCVKCGVLRTTKGECLNQIECQKRVCLSENFIKNSRLKHPEFKASKNDVFLLLHNKEKLQEFASISNIGEEWNDVVGINIENAEKYNLVRSLV